MLPSVYIRDAIIPTRKTKVKSILKIQLAPESSNSSSEQGKSAKSVTFTTTMICKEPHLKGYTEKICAAITGLPGDKIVEFETIKPFIAKWYNVVTTFSAD